MPHFCQHADLVANFHAQRLGERHIGVATANVQNADVKRHQLADLRDGFAFQVGVGDKQALVFLFALHQADFVAHARADGGHGLVQLGVVHRGNQHDVAVLQFAQMPQGNGFAATVGGGDTYAIGQGAVYIRHGFAKDFGVFHAHGAHAQGCALF